MYRDKDEHRECYTIYSQAHYHFAPFVQLRKRLHTNTLAKPLREVYNPPDTKRCLVRKLITKPNRTKTEILTTMSSPAEQLCVVSDRFSLRWFSLRV